MLLQPAQRYKPDSCLKAGFNRALDSQSINATLLKGVQMRLKGDNNARLVTDKYRQFENFAGNAQVLSQLSRKLYV